MGIPAIALSGLDQAYTQFQDATTRIAAAGDPSGSGPDVVDLSAAAVSMLAARNEFDVNIAVMKTADQMQKNVLDILA